MAHTARSAPVTPPSGSTILLRSSTRRCRLAPHPSKAFRGHRFGLQAGVLLQPACASPRPGRAATAAPPAEQALPAAEQARRSRNIVVAVDTSYDSQYACRWVLANMVRPGDVLHLLHTIPVPVLPEGLYALPDGRVAMINLKKLAQHEQAHFRAAEKEVQDWAWEILHPANVPFVVDVLREDPEGPGGKLAVSRQLCRKAEELGAAALVVASRTRGGLSEAVVGSVANWCAHHSSTPVLVLHAPQRQSADAGNRVGVAHWLTDAFKQVAPPGGVPAAVEGAGKGEDDGTVSSDDFPSGEENLIGQTASELPGTELDLSAEELPGGASAPTAAAAAALTGGKAGGRRIIVCVDDSDASERSCRWAAANLWAPGDTLHLLRIVPSLPKLLYSAGVNLGVSDSYLVVVEPPTAAYKAVAEGFMERRFAAPLRAAGVSFEAQVLVEPTDESVAGVGRALCQRAEALGAAAVVLGSHMRGGVAEVVFGSVASWVAHSCAVPVAVLH